jgi:putative phage-type endonuclease
MDREWRWHMSLSPEDLRKIGGSDIAAILGRDPHKSAVDVWQRITTGVEPEVDPEKAKLFRRGNLLEPVIRQMAKEDFGLTLTGPKKWGKGLAECIRASLDDQHWFDPSELDGFEVVEFKSVAPDASHQWGQEGTDQVPTNYLLQVQFYLWVTGATKARVIPLIGVDDLRQYFVTANLDLHNLIAEAVDSFWHKNVLEKVPPPPDGSDSYSEYLRQRYPTREKGRVIQGDETIAKLAADHREAREQAKSWEKEAERRKQALAAAMGDAEGACGFLPDGSEWTVSNKMVRRAAVLDWEALQLAHNLPADVKAKFSKQSSSPTLLNTLKEAKR